MNELIDVRIKRVWTTHKDSNRLLNQGLRAWARVESFSAQKIAQRPVEPLQAYQHTHSIPSSWPYPTYSGVSYPDNQKDGWQTYLTTQDHELTNAICVGCQICSSCLNGSTKRLFCCDILFHASWTTGCFAHSIREKEYRSFPGGPELFSLAAIFLRKE